MPSALVEDPEQILVNIPDYHRWESRRASASPVRPALREHRQLTEPPVPIAMPTSAWPSIVNTVPYHGDKVTPLAEFLEVSGLRFRFQTRVVRRFLARDSAGRQLRHAEHHKVQSGFVKAAIAFALGLEILQVQRETASQARTGLSLQGRAFQKRVFLLTEPRQLRTSDHGRQGSPVRGGTDSGPRQRHEVCERESRKSNISGAFNDWAARE